MVACCRWTTFVLTGSSRTILFRAFFVLVALDFIMHLHTLGSPGGDRNVSRLDFASLSSCKHEFVYRAGPKVDARSRAVRSELECASLCSGDPRCNAYNYVNDIEDDEDSLPAVTKQCELLQTAPARCTDLESKPKSRFKFLRKITSVPSHPTPASGNSEASDKKSAATSADPSTVKSTTSASTRTSPVTTSESALTSPSTKTSTSLTTSPTSTTSTSATTSPNTTVSTSTMALPTTTTPTSTMASPTTKASASTMTFPTTTTMTSPTTATSTSTTTSPTTTTMSTSTMTPPTTTISPASPRTTTSSPTTSSSATLTAATTTPVTSTPAATTTLSKPGTCPQSWTQVDDPTSGADLDELLLAAQDGASLMVKTTDSSTTVTYTSRMYTVNDKALCVTVPLTVKADSWKTMGTKSTWVLRKICNSNVMTDYMLDGTAKNTIVDNKWFYRRDCEPGSQKTESLINTNDGDIAQGKLSTFKENVQAGLGATVLVHIVNNGQGKQPTNTLPGNYDVFTNQIIIVKSAEDDVAAINVLSFAKSSSTSAPYLDTRMFATDGDDYNNGWDLASHKKVTSSNDNFKHSWIVDPCWTLVYTSYPDSIKRTSGDAGGSLQNLLAAVRSGKRVKVSIVEDEQTLYAEADHVVITANDVVIAQVISMATEDYKFDDDGLWSFFCVHSTGTLCLSTLPISQVTDKSSACRKTSVQWFVDSRNQNVLWETDVTGNVLRGSKDISRLHGDVRVKVQLPNDNGLERYLTAETLFFGLSQEVSALSMRILKTSLDDQSLMRTDGSGRAVAMLVTSYSKVIVRYWRPGTLTSDASIETPANVTWFTSD